MMPASPETFSRFAKYGVHVRRQPAELVSEVAKNRCVKLCRQFAFALIPSVLLVSRKPNRFGLSVRVL